MIRLKVETARDFKKLGDEDYTAYKVEPLNLRLAFHLALGLFHLRGWTFWHAKKGPDWPFKESDDYQKHLEGQCPEFAHITDLANSVKHVVLNKQRRTEMVGLASTHVEPPAFSPQLFSDAFQTRSFITIEIGPDKRVSFEKAADAVMACGTSYSPPTIGRPDAAGERARSAVRAG